MEKTKSRLLLCLLAVAMLTLTGGCSTSKNNATTRWWHSFKARYNTYYNGSQAFIDGALEKEKGNKDDYTDMIPLYAVGNKASKDLGKANFDKAIEKCELTIRKHSIKKRPKWTKNRKKTEKDIEWLNRREYNPFLWKAWYMMGRAQFNKGEFEEAASTFAYMTRLYQTQPAINGISRAWLARCYTEQEWFYDAEDIMRNMARDSITPKAQKEWDATYADFYIRQQRYEEAIPYLRKTIKHEKRRKQKAREWYLMGQIQTRLGNKAEAYKAYSKVIRLTPPYELEFNAHIAQTEVMAKGNAKKMIGRLKRMARNDKNKDYLEQVYYAIGNIYLSENDTLQAIAAYEKGVEKATRSGIEKGVLLLRLGNVYWEKEKYSDAKRCYGEAIGLIDKERPEYKELSQRSQVLDELVPFTEAIYLQDSLQTLAKMSETDRNKAIDAVIEALKKKEKEEKRKAEEEAAEKQLAKQGAMGNNANQRKQPVQNNQQTNGQWYFYNTMAVNQGKQQFQKLWGKRENADDWQRVNKTVVATEQDSDDTAEEGDNAKNSENGENGENGQEGGNAEDDAENAEADTLANDPHNREYYLAQIPFTEEQLAESNNIIKDGLFHAGVIFKDKLDNLRLCQKNLLRLENNYADYEGMDNAYYHLFLLYMRLGDRATANTYIDKLKAQFPESEWTLLLADPNYEFNSRFGRHIEDSLYAATYDAFKANRLNEVKGNTAISEKQFPLGENRPKFLFVDGLRMLGEGNAKGCTENMQQLIEKYPKSEVSEIAGMIVKGVKEGRTLLGGAFDSGSIWERRAVNVEETDSTATDTLSASPIEKFVFMLAYPEFSINQNQLLYDLAKYNFSNFMVRQFNIETELNAGIQRMIVSGFLSYDEVAQYARGLMADKNMAEKLKDLRVVIISETNLPLLGTKYSYADYEEFFRQHFTPMHVTDEQLLTIPETVEQAPDTETGGDDEEEYDDSTDEWENF